MKIIFKRCQSQHFTKDSDRSQRFFGAAKVKDSSAKLAKVEDSKVTMVQITNF